MGEVVVHITARLLDTTLTCLKAEKGGEPSGSGRLRKDFMKSMTIDGMFVAQAELLGQAGGWWHCGKKQ
jgi:hypothetical protein